MESSGSSELPQWNTGARQSPARTWLAAAREWWAAAVKERLEAARGTRAQRATASRSRAQQAAEDAARQAADAARRAAPWVILACIPNFSSSGEIKVDNDLSFNWREPPSLSLFTMRRSDFVSAMPQYISPDRDDYPYVVAADPNGGVLIRGSRRRSRNPLSLGWNWNPAKWSSPQYENVYMLCDVNTLKVAVFLPESDRRLLHTGNIGLIHGTAADGADNLNYMVVELQALACTGRARLQRFFCSTGQWRDPKEVSYPPTNRQWGRNGVISYAGKLWWVDLSYGLLACNPFLDEPELDFVALPGGCELPNCTDDLEKHRCVKVSDGKLTYVQTDFGPGIAETVSVWTLSSAELVWTRQHRMLFKEIWDDSTFRDIQMPRRVPVLALVHPKDSGVLYFFQSTPQISWVFAVELRTRRVLACEEYTMPHLPAVHHSSRFVTAWEAAHWVFSIEATAKGGWSKMIAHPKRTVSLAVSKIRSLWKKPTHQSDGNKELVVFEREEVKDALKSTQLLLRLGYFALTTFLTTLLIRRYNPSGQASVDRSAAFWMGVEMIIIAFVCVSILHQMMLISHFIHTKAPRIRAGCRWLAPFGLCVITSVWMGGYTAVIGCISPVLFRTWMTVVAGIFAVLNLLISMLMLYWCRVREEYIIEG